MKPMEKIKQVRKRLGMSLAEVGELAGMHREAVARAEHPDTDPRASTITRIAKAMGVPVCKLFDDPGRHERRRKKRKA